MKNQYLLALLTTVVLTTTPVAAWAHCGHCGVGDEAKDGAKAGHVDEDNLALEGNCPVCALGGGEMKGNPHFVTEYDGKTYQFCSLDEQNTFLSDPAKYVKAGK